MSTYDFTMSQAIELLRRCSSHTNTKLSVIADQVVRHRRLPQPAAQPSQVTQSA